MDFFTTDGNGVTRVNPGPRERGQVLESVLDDSGMDYPEVYLTVEGGDVLGYRSGGVLVWEQEGEVIATLAGVDVAAAREAWDWLVAGERDKLRGLPWRMVEE